MIVSKFLIKMIWICVLIFITHLAHAGIWGSQNWGEMYWGDQEVTAPVTSPVLSDLREMSEHYLITVKPYVAGDDGWSRITSFRYSCNNGESGTFTGYEVQIPKSGVQTLQCDFFGINAFGESSLNQVVFNTQTLVEFSRIFHDQFTSDN